MVNIEGSKLKCYNLSKAVPVHAGQIKSFRGSHSPCGPNVVHAWTTLVSLMTKIR